MDSRRPALLVAGGCAAALLCTWLIAFGTDAGLALDRRITDAVIGHQTWTSYRFATHVKPLGDPAWFVVLAAAAVALPLRRRRWALAGAVLALIAGANLTTQVLQELTATDRLVPLVPAAQWPSGHVTALASVTLGLALGVPDRMRLLAAAVALAATVTMGWTVIALRSHVPSDVVGAVFVCGSWTALAVGALSRLDRSTSKH